MFKLLWKRIPPCAIQYEVNVFDKSLDGNVLSDPDVIHDIINVSNKRKIVFSFKCVVTDCCLAKKLYNLRELFSRTSLEKRLERMILNVLY